MAERALDDLYSMMADRTVNLRQRLNAAVSASRVEPLSMPGEPEPQGVRFLRWIIDFVEPNGSRFSPQFRRESAAALAYHQRRAQKAQLQWNVADADEKRQAWTRILNGCLRAHLGRVNAWPERRDVLFRDGDLFDVPGEDPDRALTALLLPAGNRKERRRRAIDERGGMPVITSEAERMEILKPIAQIVHQRLAQFGMAR